MSENPYMLENTSEEFERTRDVAARRHTAEARALTATPPPAAVPDPADVEKVARALYDRLAAAAIEAMRGQSAAVEALARVEALAEDDEEVARMAREYEADKARRRERDYWHTLAGIREQSAARIRAAIAAPVAQAGEGR